MKSIRVKIMLSMILTTLIALISLGGVSIAMNLNSTNETLKQTMLEMSDIAAERIEQELTAHLNVAIDTGCVARLSNPDSTLEAKQKIIDERVQVHGYLRGNIIGADGISIFTGVDYNDREYFQECMQGNPHISEPLISRTTGELSIIVAAPIWQDGAPYTTVVGVVFFVPPQTFLNDIVASMQISASGSAYIIDANGTTIAHKNMDNVMSQENTIEEAKTDSSLAKLASIETKMINGEHGFATYTYGGVTKFATYSPIGTSDGWSVAVNAPMSDFMESTSIGVAITVVATAIFTIATVIISITLANGIGKPIKLCADRIELLAEGDLHTPAPKINKKDETGILASSTEKITNNLSGIIEDMAYGLRSFSEGNFAVDSNAKDLYVGDFEELAKYMYVIMEKLSKTLANIMNASDQVASGSNQVSSAAQSLSQGTVEQASAIEELNATVNDVMQKLEENVINAEDTKHKMTYVGKEMANSNAKMTEMTAAMERIGQSSTEIGKIVKTIEDIAFQTNILALNAAVEAARAGEAGKGFAVVADEVRSLASKSAEASKNTSELITGALEAIDDGTRIAMATAESLSKSVVDAQEASKLVEQISSEIVNERQAMQQINAGMDQISSVVQTNSATAEESAAASEELSGQAAIMKELTDSFTIAKLD